LRELVAGMEDYDRAGVDYIELNESCPNVPSHASGSHLDAGLLDRLDYVSQHFLRTRKRSLPVVVKFSVDTNPDQLEDLLRSLVTLRFDGIILGNTSTGYLQKRQHIHRFERTLYDRFTTTFGGGLSGRMLNGDSLMLSSLAITLLATLRPEGEFNVIRCGGVGEAADIVQSHNNGILLNQWYTGYFEAFAHHGHDVYTDLAATLQGADGAARSESRRLVNSDETLS